MVIDEYDYNKHDNDDGDESDDADSDVAKMIQERQKTTMIKYISTLPSPCRWQSNQTKVTT